MFAVFHRACTGKPFGCELPVLEYIVQGDLFRGLLGKKGSCKNQQKGENPVFQYICFHNGHTRF